MGTRRGSTPTRSRTRARTPTEARNTGPIIPVGRRAQLAPIGKDAGAATVMCRGEHHRLSVDDGGLHTDDHDAAAELALHALGGSLPDCLVYVLVWRHCFIDGDGFLRFWAEREVLDTLARAHLRREWVDNYWEGWPPEPPAAAVLFEQAWQDALGASVARRAIAAPDRAGSVHRAVQVRLRTAFVKSLAAVSAHQRPDALVPLTVSVAAGPPAAAGRLARTGSAVELRVAAEWLWDVWAEGRALADGHLVLASRGPTIDRLEWHPTGGPDREHAPVIAPANLRQ